MGRQYYVGNKNLIPLSARPLISCCVQIHHHVFITWEEEVFKASTKLDLLKINGNIFKKFQEEWTVKEAF